MEEAQRFRRDYQPQRADDDDDEDEIGPSPMAQPAEYADNQQVTALPSDSMNDHVSVLCS
jgi:hypothetical protein